MRGGGSEEGGAVSDGLLLGELMGTMDRLARQEAGHHPKESVKVCMYVYLQAVLLLLKLSTSLCMYMHSNVHMYELRSSVLSSITVPVVFSQSIVDPLGEESKDTYLAPLAIYIVCHTFLQYAVSLVVQCNIHLCTGVWFSLCVCAASMCLQVGGCRGSVPGCRRAGLPPATPPEACLQGVRGLQRDGWWGFSACA